MIKIDHRSHPDLFSLRLVTWNILVTMNRLRWPMPFALSMNLLLVVDWIQDYRKGGRIVTFLRSKCIQLRRSRTDSLVSNPSIAPRPRPPSTPIRPSHISDEELQFIQNTLPTWLTEVEAKCACKFIRLVIDCDFAILFHRSPRSSWRNSSCSPRIETIVRWTSVKTGTSIGRRLGWRSKNNDHF